MLDRPLRPLLLTLALLPALGCVAPGGGGGGDDPDRGPAPDAEPDAEPDAAGCVPDCADRACGPDGCGGTCGACPDDQVCVGGACDNAPASCGDAACDPDETCENCPADCGPCCGDGTCNADQREDCAACPADCACPDGERCDPAGRACVPACTPDCADRVCGSDGCGGTCGDCPDGTPCDADGKCTAPPDTCGDGTCDPGEDCANCLGDCPCDPGDRCERGACVLDCPDDCGPLWQATCTADGFGYRLCTPDPERPGCSAPSRRILCGDGRACVVEAGAAACAGRCQRPEVVLLVDRSSSMEGERWQFTRAALTDMATDRASFVRLGLRVFPGEGDACAAGPIAPPAFDAIDAFEAMPAPAQVAQTPIASALDGLGDAFGDPDEGESVILVTDGDETCAGEFDAEQTAATLRLRGVRTFVIGIGREANGDLLTAIAQAGGTADLGPAPYQAVEDGPGLRAALDAVFALLETGRAEQCNAADDDCDGQVDEALTAPPSARQDGVCAGAVQRCDGRWVEPDYAAIDGYEADEATCDGRDNDCDAAIDEALDPPLADRQDGVCVGALQICAEGWIEPEYRALPEYEAPEATCDGRDNDCDGATDERLAPPPAANQRGVCAGAEQICDGRWREPDYAARPGYEAPEASCDGRDNDCDGATDERLDPPPARLQAGVCRGALQICAGAWREPDYGAIADYESPETTCEGLDNDCDGRVDEDTVCPVICGRDDPNPPCNRCPEGTIVPPGWICAPAGTYTRGSPPNEPGRLGDEAQVEVDIERPFLIQATEVTRAAWRAHFPVDPANGAGCATAPGADPLDCPISRVNWWEAAAYANALTAASRTPLTPCYTLRDCEGRPGEGMECALDTPFDPTCTGYRLPTEDEWEYAARAGTRARYWSGPAAADLARVDWYAANAGGEVHSVAALPANPWGLHDVHGNVREWCSEWRIVDFTRALRGGSFDDLAEQCRAARRGDFVPDSRGRTLGLRLVRSAGGAGCGDGLCGADERCDTCPADCGACCGDGRCDAAAAESCATCAFDCACAGDLACVAGQCIECAPACGGRLCGDDGCGGTCGDCAAGDVCRAGACAPSGIELIVDEDTPIAEQDRRDVIALVPPGAVGGRVEDVHGRLVARFLPTGEPGGEVATITWDALGAAEPLDGGRRERRALYAVYEIDGAPARVPFTARVICPARNLCLGDCLAVADPCDRSCPAACAADETCIDRACVDLTGGVALAGLRPRVTGLRLGETVPRATKGEPLAVHLDRPAPAEIIVRLTSLDPAVTVPAEVRIPAGRSSAPITVQADALTHGAGLIARLGTTLRYAEIRVLPPPFADPPLRINEIDYDQPGQDLAEFVELHNPTAALQPVAGLALVFVNGDDDGDPYLTIPLDALPAIPPGGYALVGDDLGVLVPRIPLDGEVQGGDSDGVLLVDTATGLVLDAFAYDGYLLGVTEGAEQGFDLRGDRQESFSRCPNGADTQDNGADFAQTAPTPGAANACP